MRCQALPTPIAVGVALVNGDPAGGERCVDCRSHCAADELVVVCIVRIRPILNGRVCETVSCTGYKKMADPVELSTSPLRTA